PQFVASSRVSKANIEIAHDDLSVSFLVSLLDEIVAIAPRLRGLAIKRHREYVPGGIRGRPLIESSLISMSFGRSLGFTCEVLSDKYLREYEKVLFATGTSIL